MPSTNPRHNLWDRTKPGSVEDPGLLGSGSFRWLLGEGGGCAGRTVLLACPAFPVVLRSGLMADGQGLQAIAGGPVAWKLPCQILRQDAA